MQPDWTKIQKVTSKHKKVEPFVKMDKIFSMTEQEIKKAIIKYEKTWCPLEIENYLRDTEFNLDNVIVDHVKIDKYGSIFCDVKWIITLSQQQSEYPANTFEKGK